MTALGALCVPDSGYRSEIEYHDHVGGRSPDCRFLPLAAGTAGGDFGVLQAFPRPCEGDPSSITTAREVLESHLLALAAERSRLNGETISHGRLPSSGLVPL